MITESESRGDELVATQFTTVELCGEIQYSALLLFRTPAETPEFKPVSGAELNS